jgi:hypothetical protein
MNINFRLTNTLLLFVLFGAIQCLPITNGCLAQTKPQITIVTGEPSRPALEAKAFGEVKPFKRTRPSLKASILAHPIPEASLVFILPDKKDSQVTVQLPKEAKKLLLGCWKAELTFYYLRAFEVHDLQTRINEANVFGNIVGDTHVQLQKLSIDTPTGRRNISLNEAVSLTHLLNNSAQKVVNEAKESVSRKPVAGIRPLYGPKPEARNLPMPKRSSAR